MQSYNFVSYECKASPLPQLKEQQFENIVSSFQELFNVVGVRKKYQVWQEMELPYLSLRSLLYTGGEHEDHRNTTIYSRADLSVILFSRELRQFYSFETKMELLKNKAVISVLFENFLGIQKYCKERCLFLVSRRELQPKAAIRNTFFWEQASLNTTGLTYK